jgi:PAS domain S-box-containing protein
MLIPAIPANESARLAALYHCKILDTAPEETFDEITHLAANCCDAPIALVSLIDVDRQWFKSKIGLEVAETSRNLSFCAHAILQPDVFSVSDALADERFADNPLVTGEPFIRAYTGVPLLTSKGHALGTLCVIDQVPRQFSTKQLENLQLLACQLVRQLELRHNLIELERTVVTRKAIAKAPQRVLNTVVIGFSLVLAVLIGLATLSYGSFTALISSGVTPHATGMDLERSLHHVSELEIQQQWLQQIQVQTLATQTNYLIAIAVTVGISCLLGYLTYQEGQRHYQTEATLEQERDFIAAVLDTVGALVIVLDAQGKVVRFNRNCEQVSGYTFAEVWQKYLWDVFLPSHEISSVKAVFNNLQAGYFPNHHRNYWLTKTGETRLIDWSNTVLVNSQGIVEYVIGTGIDITDRQKAEQAVSQLATIVRSSDDAIVSLDLDGRVVSWNPGAERIYGYLFEEAKGQKLTDLVMLSSSTAVEDPLLNSTQPELHHANPYQAQHRTKYGQRIDMFLTVSLLKDSGGGVLGSSMIARDISHLYAIERMKEEFVSIVSHELRTPLGSLRGSLGLLLTGKLGNLSEKGQRMLNIAINNTDRLVRLIDEILDLERLESHKFPLSKEICNITDIIQQVTEIMQPALEKTGIKLVVSTIPASLNADSPCLVRALTNLIDNAVKFSASGQTIWLTTELKLQDSIRVQASSDSSSALSQLLIQVKDQGSGIPNHQLEAVFERFYQVDASDARQKGGTGLGLTICRSIVKQHGGQIWVESLLGQGSTFFVKLPVQQDEVLQI